MCMVEQIKRNQFCFIGPKAESSANYYDTVLSHGYSGDIVFLAWESAHKFGTRVISDNLASFKDGIAIGEDALTAAEYIDAEYQKAFMSCDEYGRGKKMKDIMNKIYDSAENQFAVKTKLY